MEARSKYNAPRLGRNGCLGIGVLGLAFCFVLLLSTCVSRVEVMRAQSPDGSLTATVFEINGGATTDFAYEIAVARNWPIHWDHAVAGLYGAGRSDCAYGVNIRWIDNNTLMIAYKDAKSVDLDRAAQLLGREVRIIAKSGINDPAAPCGGMEYGQQGRVVNVR